MIVYQNLDISKDLDAKRLQFESIVSKYQLTQTRSSTALAIVGHKYKSPFDRPTHASGGGVLKIKNFYYEATASHSNFRVTSVKPNANYIEARRQIYGETDGGDSDGVFSLANCFKNSRRAYDYKLCAVSYEMDQTLRAAASAAFVGVIEKTIVPCHLYVIEHSKLPSVLQYTENPNTVEKVLIGFYPNEDVEESLAKLPSFIFFAFGVVLVVSKLK